MKHLVPSRAEETGTEILDPTTLYVGPTAAQLYAKIIPRTAVDAVVKNNPMPRIPRNQEKIDADSARELADKLLRRIFPGMARLRDQSGGDLDAYIAKAIADHKSAGMPAQEAELKRQFDDYQSVQRSLEALCKSDLVQPQSMIPIEYLPELFMAVPVWFFWAGESVSSEAARIDAEKDPNVHAYLRHFCSLFPSDRWSDTFLMFNRRMRTQRTYRGDVVPSELLKKAKKLAPVFDYLVIMTPYHDVAGRDWQDLTWIRSIDPYIVGFKKDLPFMFVVGRFSDSGIFPLMHEMIADTIAYLRANIERLKGFDNDGIAPYWYQHANPSGSVNALGKHLKKHTQELLAAFDEGCLFDWLRDSKVTLPTK